MEEAEAEGGEKGAGGGFWEAETCISIGKGKGSPGELEERIKRMNKDIMEEWEERSRSRRRGLSGRRDRGGALAVRELAGEAMDNYEDQIDMTKRKQVNANCRLLYGIYLYRVSSHLDSQ